MLNAGIAALPVKRNRRLSAEELQSVCRATFKEADVAACGDEAETLLCQLHTVGWTPTCITRHLAGFFARLDHLLNGTMQRFSGFSRSRLETHRERQITRADPAAIDA